MCLGSGPGMTCGGGDGKVGEGTVTARTFVIVGAGHASAQLCESLRKGGFDGRIVLIGDETWLPYQRPPLSKGYLLGEVARERLFVKPQSFYETQGVELRLGVAASRIDREGKAVELADGSRVAYDRLALLTGARVRRLTCPGASLKGVHYVRGIDDIDALEDALPAARRAVVVGGGYIGLEAAAVLRKKGLEVTLLHRSPRLLSRVASAETAALFRTLHEEEGVHIRLNQTIRSIEGAGRVERVEIERMKVDHVAHAKRVEIEADLVVAGIGVLPNQSLAAQAGLPTEDGIVVDARCRTADPDIFAAGDVAEHPHPPYGTIRLESVQNALDQAKACAAAMLDTGEDYAAVPWFWSDQFDVKFQSAGLPHGYTRAVQRAGEKPRSASVWLYAGARLICVEAMNEPRAYMTGKRWIEQGASPAPDALADAATPLKAVPVEAAA